MIRDRSYLQSGPLLLIIIVCSLPIVPFIHAVRPSLGCASTSDTGLGSDLTPGESMEFTRTVPGTQQRTHSLTIPNNYGKVETSPSPLLLFFHGWGGNHKECGPRCNSLAADRGFVSVALTGYGPANYASWNHGGSSSSPGSEGATCTSTTTNYCNKYSSSGCDCETADNCWWTTCFDSVSQTLAILDEVEQNLCVDLDQIWAVGCSNGGMFTFELAADERSAFRLAGIIPIVGLPHYGFSTGPMVEGIRMMGMWGRKDTVVPPISNTDNPDKTLDTDSNGWYYTSSNKVMSDWTSGNSCTGTGQDPLDINDWGIGSYSDSLSCTLGCSERDDGVRVVGCIFNGGHICYKDYMWEPIFNFMLDKPPPPPCTENKDDTFLLKKTKKGKPSIQNCSWLASKSKKWKKRICRNRVDHDGVLAPAQEVCQITCDSCDICHQNGRTKFVRKIRSNGTPILKRCAWLSTRTNSKKNELCETLTKSHGGYGPPRDACPVECKVGDCF